MGKQGVFFARWQARISSKKEKREPRVWDVSWGREVAKVRFTIRGVHGLGRPQLSRAWASLINRLGWVGLSNGKPEARPGA